MNKEKDLLVKRLPVAFAVLESLGKSIWDMGTAVTPMTMYHASEIQHNATYCSSLFGSTIAGFGPDFGHVTLDVRYKLATIRVFNSLVDVLTFMYINANEIVENETNWDAKKVAATVMDNIRDTSEILVHLVDMP